MADVWASEDAVAPTVAPPDPLHPDPTSADPANLTGGPVGVVDALPVGVVGALPVGVVVLGADGHVLVWNAAAEDLTGWAAAKVLGRPLDAFTHLDLPTVARVLAEVRAGRPFAGRLPAHPPSGRSLYFRAAPGPGATFVGVLQDVADTNTEDEAFALLDALWETAPVGLAYLDTALRYRRVNGAVPERHGGSDDERLGRSLEEVHGQVGTQMANVLRQVVADGRPRHDVPVRAGCGPGRGRTPSGGCTSTRCATGVR